MAKIIEGKLDATRLKFGITVSRFNNIICDRLIDGAIDALLRHGAVSNNIHIVRVPGVFEIPMAARKMVGADLYDAVICLGAVIRGATPHFDYVSAEVTKGVATVGLQSYIPVTLGVLTTDNLEQAIERAGAKEGNKGYDAAVSAIEMVNLYRVI